MTLEEFKALPYLLTPGQVVGCGYTAATLVKYAAHGILLVILPKGCAQRRFQKRQIAKLNGWESALDFAGWAREKSMLRLNAVCQWTGYTEETVSHIVAAGGLLRVQPGGIGYGLFRKSDVGAWLGLTENL